MTTKYLRRKDDGSIYVWTETLAKRVDMEPCDAPEIVRTPKAKAETKPEPSQNSGDQGAGIVLTVDDVYTITDKAELRRLLEGRNIHVAGNPSLKTLQAKLAEALQG